MGTRKFFWLIFGVCAFSTVANVFQLLVVNTMSLVELPQAYERFRSLISGATDMDKLKTVCLSLTQLTEAEQKGRAQFIIYTPLIALITSIVCALLAAWALASTRTKKLTR